MRIATFPYNNFELHDIDSSIRRAFLALYGRRTVSLDSFSISARSPADMLYLDDSEPERFFAPQSSSPPLNAPESALRAFHRFVYRRLPESNAIISGRPPFTFAMLDSGTTLSTETSMLRKRGVNDVSQFILDVELSDNSNHPQLLERAIALSTRNDMNHILILLRGQMLIVCAQNLFEAVVHYQNIEHSARIQFSSIPLAAHREARP